MSLNPAAYSEIAEIATAIEEQLRYDIINKPATIFGPLNASGNLSASIRFELSDTKLTFYGASYWPQADEGSPPGTRVGVLALVKWLADKGIRTEDPFERAEAISETIYDEGTVAWQQGGTNIFSDVFDASEALPLIQKIVQNGITDKINQTLKTYYKPKTA